MSEGSEDTKLASWKFPTCLCSFLLLQILNTRHATSCVLHDENDTALIFMWTVSFYLSDLWINSSGFELCAEGTVACHSSLSHLKNPHTRAKCIALHYCDMNSALNGNSLSLWLVARLIIASTSQSLVTWNGCNCHFKYQCGRTAPTSLCENNNIKLQMCRLHPTVRIAQYSRLNMQVKCPAAETSCSFSDPARPSQLSGSALLWLGVKWHDAYPLSVLWLL